VAHSAPAAKRHIHSLRPIRLIFTASIDFSAPRCERIRVLNRLRAEALATLPLASIPAFYPEHAYDIAGLLKGLRELPSGEEVRELRDHIKRLNKAHSLAVARRDDPRWDLVSFAGQRDLGPALLGQWPAYRNSPLSRPGWVIVHISSTSVGAYPEQDVDARVAMASSERPNQGQAASKC
jgi:hypothetical protein